MTQDFFRDLVIPGTVISIGGKQTIYANAYLPEEIDAVIADYDFYDLFFLGGVSPAIGKTRAKDKDIIKKNYIYFDIDVRKTVEFDATDEEIKALATEEYLPKLIDSPFKNWRYVVFTGNGLHIYYFSTEPISIRDTDYWRMGMRLLNAEFSEVIGVKSDDQCINPARLGRLPGSKNCKDKNNPKVVEIIAHQDVRSNILLGIEEMGKAESDRIAQENVERGKSLALEFPQESDNYKIINTIPVSSVAQILFGWSTDGRNFWDGKSSKPKACFVPPESNVLIHGGTDHIPESATGFSPFTLVQAKNKFSSKQVFDWFQEHFPLAFVKKDLDPSGNVTGIMKRIRGKSRSKSLNISEDLDDLRLMVRGGVTRVGALSATGKSSFAYYVAFSLLQQGHRGILFSTEVDDERCMASFARMLTGRPAWDFLEGRVPYPEDFEQKMHGFSVYDSIRTKNSLREMENILLGEIESNKDNPPSFIVVDFCQMVTPKMKTNDPFSAARQYAIESQEIAQKYNIAYLCLSQLSVFEAMNDKGDRQSIIPFENSKMLFSVADIACMLKRPKGLAARGQPMELDIRKHKFIDPCPELAYVKFDVHHGTYCRAYPPFPKMGTFIT